MNNDWPPSGYSEVEIYSPNDKYPIIVALFLLVPSTIIVYQPLSDAITPLTTVIMAIAHTTGLTNHPIAFLGLTFVTPLIWAILSAIIITALHETVHYITSASLGHNPSFEWTKWMGVPTPSVIAYSTHIKRWEDLWMLISPFAVLSLILGVSMWLEGGLVSGTAAIMFAVNAIPSCNDIYNLIKIGRLPSGTMLANFHDNGERRTEYVYPV